VKLKRRGKVQGEGMMAPEPPDPNLLTEQYELPPDPMGDAQQLAVMEDDRRREAEHLETREQRVLKAVAQSFIERHGEVIYARRLGAFGLTVWRWSDSAVLRHRVVFEARWTTVQFEIERWRHL
jgi:hypothetical protein